jgi:hypothetical protein
MSRGLKRASAIVTSFYSFGVAIAFAGPLTACFSTRFHDLSKAMSRFPTFLPALP